MGNGIPHRSHEGRRPVRRSSAPVLSIVTLASLLAAAGSASGHAAGSAHPDEWNRLVLIILLMAAAIAAFVYIWMGVAMWRFREKSPYVRKEPKTDDSRLESVWTLIPLILVTIIVILSVNVMTTTEDIPEGGTRIQVVGRQFEWEFTYPDNNTTKNELWVEEGQNVIFEITATDVIHSFFLPDFYLKVDAIPGNVDETYIVAEPPGDYQIYCAEYCGDVHSEMLGWLHIYPKGANGGKAWGPPPGEVPPPPETERLAEDIELREDGGPGPAQPWSIDPPVLELPIDGEVSLRVWNNGTIEHHLALGPPYGRTVGPIPPGEFRYLNFTSDMPTAGIVCLCDEEGHGDMGLAMTLVVVDEPVEGEGAVPEITFPWVQSIFGLALLVLGVALVAAIRPPSGPGVPAEGVEGSGKENPGGGSGCEEGGGG